MSPCRRKISGFSGERFIKGKNTEKAKMIYLKLFWISAGLFWIIFMLSKWLGWKIVRQKLEDYGGLFSIWLLCLAFIAIATKDPINIAGMPLPVDVQWFGTVALGGFSAWRFYLNPLKTKVYEMDRELGEVKTRVNRLESDMTRVERYFEKVDRNFEKIEGKIEKIMEILLRKQRSLS